MKYGLYYCKDTSTIGDDFWAYAQSLFYPHIDYLIDNTSIYKFKSLEDEPVATIISAFVEPRNREWGFLPPENIIPLFIGSYFRSTMWEFLENGIIKDYLKAHEPIGIRSLTHLPKFQSMGIEAYFSGCVTLTLPQLDKREGSYICCVDVPEQIVDCIRNEVGDSFEVREMTHELWKLGEKEYKKHCELSMKERFDIVKEYLQIYANAHCVVTTRLHCALPCLTQQTPVLLVLPRNGEGIVDMEDRLGGFRELLHVEYYDNFLNRKNTYDMINPPDNSNEYIKYRESIDKCIKKFITLCESGEIQNNHTYSEKERLEELVDLLEKKVTQLKNVVDGKNIKIQELENQLNI